MRRTLATALTAAVLPIAALAAAAPVSAATGDATVDVFHGVAGPGRLRRRREGAQRVHPGSFSAQLPLPAGSHDLAVRPAGAVADSDPAIEATVSVEPRVAAPAR